MAIKTTAVSATPIGLPDSQSSGAYGIGADREMYYKIWDGTRYLPSGLDWAQLGGKFDSAPSVTVNNRELAPWTGRVFGLGLSDEMFQRSVSNVSWPPPDEAWAPIGGTFVGPPTAFSFGTENKHGVVGLETDNQPHLRIFNGDNQPVADWLPLGGKLIFDMAIAVISSTPGEQSHTGTTVAVFGVGVGRQMFQLTMDLSQWPPALTEWQDIGECFASPPAVAQWNNNRVDIFGLDMNQAMLHRAWENGNWLGGWESLGGTFTSVPSVVSTRSNSIDIFGIGTDDQMYHKVWDGNDWVPSGTDWEPLGGLFASAPTAIAVSFNQLQVFGLGLGLDMLHKLWDGKKWLPSPTGWKKMGGLFEIPRATQLPSQLDFEADIVFPSGISVGGAVHITLFRDGTSVFYGHFHDSGAAGYNCAIVCGIADGSGRVYKFSESGPVAGTFEVGSRDFPWNDPAPVHAEIRDHWEDLFPCGGAQFRVRADVNINVASLWPIFVPGFGRVIQVLGIIEK